MAPSEDHQRGTEQTGSAFSRLPVAPKTGEALSPRAQPGYYPGYHILSQQNFWDAATRNLVVGRVEQVPQISFFSPDEAQLMQAVLDRVLPQDDRDEAHKIPLLPALDERLASGRINGYRYEHMPPDGEAYRLGLQGIEAIAQHLYHQPFIELEPLEQDQVLLTLHDGNPSAGAEIWERVSVNHFWAMLLQDAVSIYYAHPYAWDEIGYGGPAYPRGYIRLRNGQPESWEVQEQRYDWIVPPTTLSSEASRQGEHGLDEPRHGTADTH